MDNQGSRPYPVGSYMDPVESLAELQKVRYNQAASNLHIQTHNLHPPTIYPGHPGPPLPERPPQEIIDQHIHPSMRHSISSSTMNSQLPNQSRLHGPREFPSRFSTGNLNVQLQEEQLNPEFAVPQVYKAPYPTYSPSSSGRYDQFASSPIDSRENYFSRKLTPSDIPTSPTPNFNVSPSLRISPDRTTFQLQNNSNILLNSPISALPDVPQLTPNSLYSPASYSERNNSSRSQHNSPSPSKGGLYGPRSRPSRNSLHQNFSPSTSPNKTYYDHRTSWRSEYSVNVIDTDDDEEQEEDDNEILENIFDDSHRIEEPSESSNESSNMEVINLPSLDDIPAPNTRMINKVLNKNLPPVPPLIEINEDVVLPTLPFSARSLKTNHLNECPNIYLLSEIFSWSVKLTEEWSDGLVVTQSEYKKSLKNLINHHISNIRSFQLDKYVNSILLSFERQNSIYIDENDNIHFFSNVKTLGVLPALTPCYSYIHVKNPITSYQCYSSRCPLLISKPPVPQAPPEESINGKLGEWISYWNITSQDLLELDSNEVKKQSHIFELIRQQQNIIKLGEIQVKIYGQSFKNTKPQLLPDISRFYNDAFNSVKPLIEIHKKHLLEPLIHKLNTQGKFISGIGEIFLNWSKLCTVQYLKYTEQMASVRELIKYEKSKNSRFSQWLVELDSNPSVMSSALDHNRIFFSGFSGHTQSLALVLDSVLKRTKESDEDHHCLNLAIEAVANLNKKINETQGLVLESRELKILSRQLVWRNNIIEIDLKLFEPNRKIIKRGMVTRKDKWSSTVNLLILLDNYLLITDAQRDRTLRIIEKPIPIEFLQIETKDPQQITSPTESNSESETDYQFSIRHSGQNLSYKFYTESLNERDSWIQSFNRVKQTKGKSSSTEPYQINILSDQFQYPDGQQPQKLPICVPGSNIDLVLKSFQTSIEQQFQGLSISRPVMVSEVLSATTIHFQNQSYHILGLQFGLFMTEVNNPRGWKRVLDLAKISQVAQLQNLLILASDKGLYYFTIVSLLLNYYDLNQEGAIVGERLSKHGVLWFKIGNYYNTTLLFVLKSQIQSTIAGPKFKVFSPIFNQFGKFESFVLYKKFQIPNDCYDISIFNSMFVLHTSKGFEILTFQVLNESQLIPKFIESTKKPKTEIELIKKNLNAGNCKPLKMVKVPNRPQFYLIYDTFAMVIDTIGQLISDKFIFPFKFKCIKISIQDEFLICIGNDIVEIFNLSYDELEGFEKFDPVQIITGKDVKLLDENNSKISIAHPAIPGRQLILQLDRTN